MEEPAPARDRVSALLEAVLAVGSDLDLQAVLRRIVEAAVQLSDATYGALGVLDEDGTGLGRFLVVGVDEDVLAAIGEPPRGRGVLGQLIRDPRPLRLDDLATAPGAYGLPPGHPPMHTFLGVPVRVRDQVFGNLYLTEKRGGGPFDEQDEAVVLALAAAAGVAVQNARLYAESRRRERELEAAGEVATALLSGAEPVQVLALLARLAREVARAALAVVALPVDGERLLVEVADGHDAEALRGRLLDRAASGLPDVLHSGKVAGLDPDDVLVQACGAAQEEPAPYAGVERRSATYAGGPGGPTGIAVPLGTPGEPARGILAVCGLPAAETDSVGTVASLAAQAAVALELAERRRDAERFAVFEDRERIARDLHDLIIQRLFATGMQLEGASRLVAERPAEAALRMRRAVDDLDGTIRELRSTIYGLQAPADGAASLRALLLQVVDAGTEQLGFAPSLRLSGMRDTQVPPTVAKHLLAALREALSNAARHAAAQSVDVLVALHDGELLLQVDDDGTGLPAHGRRSGLDNLAARAEQLDGELVVSSEPGRGTRLSWRVPVG